MTDLDALSQRLIQIRDERRLLKEQDKELSKEFEEISEQVLAAMNEMGTDSTRTAHASMSASTQIVANVKDWDSLYQFIRDNDAFFLLQKRVSNTAWREQRELTGDIAGTEAYEKVSLNLRAR